MKQLRYKNTIIPGYFIDENGKIYDSNGVEQELKLYPRRDYYFFKGHEVHKMVVHSFFGYKEGFDIHHLNLVKTDNRLSNLVYLTRSEHRRLHMTENNIFLGKKRSPETKEKISSAKKGMKLSAKHKEKIRSTRKRKKVYCLELNKVFDSILQAARELSLNNGGISNCCNGKCKTHAGYHFSYYS